MTVETLLQTEWNEPDGIAPRGTIVIVGGRGEGAPVYQRFGRRISSDAYRVRFVEGDLTDLEDLGRRIDGALSDPDAALPYVLLGSDTGAAVVLDYVTRRTDLTQPDAAVVAGTSFPDDEVVGIDNEIVARTACPNHRGVLGREGLDHALVSATEVHIDLPAEGPIGIPVLAVHGAADEISPAERAREVLGRLQTRVELVTIDGGLHDALNDVTHRTVAATMVRFLERLKRGADLRPIAVEEVL